MSSWDVKDTGKRARSPPSIDLKVDTVTSLPYDSQLDPFVSSTLDEDHGCGIDHRDSQTQVLATLGDSDTTLRSTPPRASKRLANMTKISILHEAMSRKAGLREGRDGSANGKSVKKVIAKSRLCRVTLTESEATKFAELLYDCV